MSCATRLRGGYRWRAHSWSPWAERRSFCSTTPGRVRRIRHSIQRDLVTITDVAIAGVDGKIYCHTGGSQLAGLQSAIDDLVAKDPKGLSVGTYTQTARGPALPIGMVSRGTDGKAQAYIEIFVNMDQLVSELTTATKGLEDARTIVADRNGTVLLALPADIAQQGQPVPAQLRNSSTRRGLARSDSPEATGIPNNRLSARGRGAPARNHLCPSRGATDGPDQPGGRNQYFDCSGRIRSRLPLAWFIGERFIQRPVDVSERDAVGTALG